MYMCVCIHMYDHVCVCVNIKFRSAAFFRSLQIPQQSRMAIVPSIALGVEEAMLVWKLIGIPVVTMRIVELTQLVTQHLHPHKCRTFHTRPLLYPNERFSK